MWQSKFRVWCELEFDGKIEKSMESAASWFLLSQTGKLWSYDPGEAPRPLERNYKKAIPLFYAGRTDSENEEIYAGDILEIEGHINHVVGFEKGMFCWQNVVPYEPIHIKLAKYKCKIIGNIYENPELKGKYKGGE